MFSVFDHTWAQVCYTIDDQSLCQAAGDGIVRVQNLLYFGIRIISGLQMRSPWRYAIRFTENDSCYLHRILISYMDGSNLINVKYMNLH